MPRLDTLRELVAQTPADSRVRFMLAMELTNAQRFEEALAEFAELVTRDPAYVTGFFQAARAAESMGRIEDARAWLERGIEAARRIGDRHAESEMSQALELLV